MAETLEMRLRRELENECRHDVILDLIKQGADCNCTYFNSENLRFTSPMQMAAERVGRENDRHDILCMLYEMRNNPREKQIEEYINFCCNNYYLFQDEYNEAILIYTVNCLLHTDIMEHTVKDYDILIAAVNDFDNVVKRGNELSTGYQPEITLKLRIFSLLWQILQMNYKRTIIIGTKERQTLEKELTATEKELTAMKNELLHNLEIYYLLQDVYHIPRDPIVDIMDKSFSDIDESHRFLLRKYYEPIAKNMISKIKKLEVNQEYTILSGWMRHAVCLSFRRISDSHVYIRVDNPSSQNPQGKHEVDESIQNYHKIKPKILGHLPVSNLDDNLEYFISLTDKIARSVPEEDGISLIYNEQKQICHLTEKHNEDIPSFLEQAATNCFLKCFEPGFRMRLGQEHSQLCDKLLAYEKQSAQWLRRSCEQKYQRSFQSYYLHFSSLPEKNEKNLSSVAGQSSLQDKLKASYKEKYQYLPNFMIEDNWKSSMENYIPLKLEIDHGKEVQQEEISLENLFAKQRVLLLGNTGCGKTTICAYIAYSWSCEILCKNFKWLFYIKMRNLNLNFYSHQKGNNIDLLLNIIEEECFEKYQLSEKDRKDLERELKTPENILWILDGLDERGISSASLQSIEQELLAKPNLLLTSRPSAIHRSELDMKVQIKSFTESDIKNFITNYFIGTSRTQGEKCWSSIESSEQLRQTAKIPACLQLTCNLWASRTETFDSIFTKEELYHQMCEHLLRRYLLKFHRLSTSALVGKDIFQEPAAVGFGYLEYLAFKATKLHRLTISRIEIITTTNGLLFPVVDIGLLICERQRIDPLIEDNYYFIHRSFQEYLCCRYIIRILTTSSATEQEKEVLQFIGEKKYDRRMQDTFRLFFEMEGSKSCTDKFWAAVDGEPQDLVGLRHCPRIIQWFPSGSFVLPLEEENINMRTTDAISEWIIKKDRRAHDFGNTYLFDWFYTKIPNGCWLTAWEEDLWIQDPPKRRYFLPDVWSSKHINILREVYNRIPAKDVNLLHHLIKDGPTTNNLKRLSLDSNLFTLRKVNDQNETFRELHAAQELARQRKEIISLEGFQKILENYESFAELNRQTVASGRETWRLSVHPSVFTHIDDKTLKFLSYLTEEHPLFYRDFRLPVISFLQLYASSSDANEHILRSLVVSIAFSSECILTALSGEQKAIRVHHNENDVDIKLTESQWDQLKKAFKDARNEYGYSCFFQHNN